MGWSKDLKKLARKRNIDAEKLVRASVIQAANVAIIKSPVGNPDLWVWNHPELGYVDYVAWKGYPDGYVGGQFRANWRISLDMVDYAIKERTNFRVVPQEVAAGLSGFKMGQAITFSNPMPYGPRLEYDAWSTQAPDGMVRPAVAALKKALSGESKK